MWLAWPPCSTRSSHSDVGRGEIGSDGLGVPTLAAATVPAMGDCGAGLLDAFSCCQTLLQNMGVTDHAPVIQPQPPNVLPAPVCSSP